METRSVSDLWREYLAMTLEMDKFLGRDDLDMFFELMDQRENLQAAIDRQPHDDFRLSAQGREIIGRISRENQLIALKMRQWLNKARQQETVSQAYDKYSHVGANMDFTR